MTLSKHIMKAFIYLDFSVSDSYNKKEMSLQQLISSVISIKFINLGAPLGPHYKTGRLHRRRPYICIPACGM